MFKSLFFAKSFWSSKLGQASIASIAAMCAMIIVTTQFGDDGSHVAAMAQPHASAVTMVEIA